MSTSKQKNLRNTLEQGRIRQLRLTERLSLWVAGRRDGRRGLPALDEDGIWNSPLLHRERDAYEEFCARTWGRQQLDLEGNYAALSRLIRNYEHAIRECGEAEAALNLRQAAEQSSGNLRKKGEDGLTEAQVASRRSREREQRLASYRAGVGEARVKREKALEELAVLHAELLEAEHSGRMACGRVREHTLQRADAYWNAALRCHRNRDKLPLSPNMICMDSAEEQFMKSHEVMMKQAEELLRFAAEKEESR